MRVEEAGVAATSSGTGQDGPVLTDGTMGNLIAKLRAWYATEPGRKKSRYFMASVITTIFSQVVLFALNSAAFAGAVVCSVITTSLSAIPSYYLNRVWAWGKSGRSHLMREVVPFWVLAFVGLFASMGTVAIADHQSKLAGLPTIEIKVVDNVAYLMAYVIVWFAKFVIFDKLVFIDHGVPETSAAGSAGSS